MLAYSFPTQEAVPIQPKVPVATYLSLDEIRATGGGRLMTLAYALLNQRATDERADATFRAIRAETMSRWGWRHHD